MKTSFGEIISSRVTTDEVKSFLKSNAKTFLVMGIVLAPSIAMSSTTGSLGDKAFSSVYEFMHEAATGSLGKAIAIGGGVGGLVLGAMSGKVLPALSGGVLAICAVLIPKVIDSVFASAII